jgi:phenol hydroxylase P5 protein
MNWDMVEPTHLAEIQAVTSLTAHTKRLTLRPLEHRLQFQPGQWISLKLPIGERPPLNRAYSLAEPPASTGEVSLVFDHVPGGIASTYLDQLRPGDRFSFSGPYGRFVLPELQDKQLLLIGRYSGLVPLRCMIRSLIHQQALPVTTLIAHAPSAGEQLYHEELIGLAQRHEQFRYVPLVAKEPGAVDGTLAMIRGLVDGNRRWIPMIAGVKAFARPLRECFVEMGFDRKEVKLETYD